MKMKITIILLLLTLSLVCAEVEFHLIWQVPGTLTDITISDLNEDGFHEILMSTGSSTEKVMNTPTGPSIAMVCEGTVSQYSSDGTLVWEKNVCKNSAATDPCYSNGCISTLSASNICTTTTQYILTGCCYCGTSSILRIYNSQGSLIQELYNDDGLGNPVPISGCIRKILAADIDADNCKEIIATTNLQLFIWDTDCTDCTIPTLPTYRTIDLPVAQRPSGTIYDVIVVNFDDDSIPTKEIVVAADEVTVYEHDFTLKWKYEIDASRPVRALAAYDLDSDTEAHAIDQDPDLDIELVVGESWYIYVLDNNEQNNTNPADDTPNLKWEHSTSPYDVNAVFAGAYVGKRNVVGGSATTVYVLDYNGTVLTTINAPSEVRWLDTADFDKDGQPELVTFCNGYVAVFSQEEMVWISENLQGTFIRGDALDTNLDGFPEIVAGYSTGLYVMGVQELTSTTDSEADQLYNMGKTLFDKGDLVNAVIYFEQARIKYEEAGNSFMAIQSQKKITECEKFMDTDRIVNAAMEELRNMGYERASYLFGEAADLYSRVGDKNKMSQMRILKEASGKLWQAHETLLEAHRLLLEEQYTEASVEAEWARHSYEDVSNLFLTLSVNSVYETLKLEISSKMRECDEISHICDQFLELESQLEQAESHHRDGDRSFSNELYAQAKSSYQQAANHYSGAAQGYEELHISLGKRVDGFQRAISDIDDKILILEESDIFESYQDMETSEIISNLQVQKAVYNDLIDEYEDLAGSVERTSRDCRNRASTTSNLSEQSYSFGEQIIEYGAGMLKPPTGIAVGLGLLIITLIGVAVGKGKYIALVLVILIMIFVGITVFQVAFS
jgi:tetratricopeptide (TPR) repeat protein